MMNNTHFDSLRYALEQASGGKNTLLFDDAGMPSTMVYIPRFQVSDVLDGGSNTTHPAFKINGQEVKGIWISKYLNVVENGRAYSRAGVDPATSVNFDQAKSYCQAKGKGWHLMTMAEQGALVLWCLKNGFWPHGNTDYGKSHLAAWEHGQATTESGGQVNHTATGSGPLSWYHNNAPDGIADLVGNVWEWRGGMRLMDGEIQVIPDNDSAAGVNEGKESLLWKAISTTGSIVAPGTSGTLHFDGSSAGDDKTTDHTIGGAPRLNDKCEFPQYTGGSTDAYYGQGSVAFKSLTKTEAIAEVPEILRVLALYPPEGFDKESNFWMRNYGERLPIVGGNWNNRANAGLAALDLNLARSHADSYLGFRAAYAEI